MEKRNTFISLKSLFTLDYVSHSHGKVIFRHGYVCKVFSLLACIDTLNFLLKTCLAFIYLVYVVESMKCMPLWASGGQRTAWSVASLFCERLQG